MHTVDNAAVRESFASEIYEMGVQKAKAEILNRLPEEFSVLHRQGEIHIHDLESFGKLYNCCTPNLVAYLEQHSPSGGSGWAVITEAFETLKLLITRLAVVQSGGIGFGNLDCDLEAWFTQQGVSPTEEHVAVLEECTKNFIRWVNKDHTRFCRETYYLTLNLGLATGFWGRAVTRALIGGLEAAPARYAKPNLVFKVCGAVNGRSGSVNYDLLQLAQQCTARRMIPTYLLMDSAPNRGCDPKKLNIMGCRTRVYDNVNGSVGTIGRGNIAYVSVNLPRIALISEGRPAFFRKLSQTMDICCRLLELRNQWMVETKGRYVEFVWKEGLWTGISGLEELLKQGTYSIGFIVLAETVEILTGQKLHQSEVSRVLAEEIVRYMQKFVQEQRERTGRTVSLLATPGEMISGRFCELDRALCPSPLQDKGFYTNSFHVEVDAKISPFQKLKLESTFHSLCNGGAISYVECSSALLGNTQAVADLIAYGTEIGISYLGINFPLDICRTCGQSGTFDRCPDCGSDQITRMRRVSGYLEDAAFFTNGKKQEILYRTANLPFDGIDT